MTSNLPKPTFHSCDETSLTMSLDISTIALITSGKTLKLQYKIPQVPWTEAKSVDVNTDSKVNIKQSNVNVEDLNPGTPYQLRYCLYDGDNAIEFGPETVFDTSPVDCTPKKKKCIVS